MKASIALKAAHQIMKASNYTLNWSDCLKLGWAKVANLIELKSQLAAKLKAGIVAFKFEKLSTGEERTAIGTLKDSLFTYEPKTDGKSKKKNPFVLAFWDLENNGFRAINITTFISIIDTIPMSQEDEICFVEFAKINNNQLVKS